MFNKILIANRGEIAARIITRRTQLKITHSVLDTMERGVIMDFSGGSS